jgi:hypothetical protein
MHSNKSARKIIVKNQFNAHKLNVAFLIIWRIFHTPRESALLQLLEKRPRRTKTAPAENRQKKTLRYQGSFFRCGRSPVIWRRRRDSNFDDDICVFRADKGPEADFT